ncbi:MAG: PEP-CTERM sorting domain-containing protein [Moorea sp. SIO3G5]|nr:PEP-CTERM sorting domain-containing protein [Moorena sp. SIO3G5]
MLATKLKKQLLSGLLSSPTHLSIGLAKIGVGVAVVTGAVSNPAFADPPPEPQLPNVFCFRFTDIKAVEGDPEQDRFQFEFEVLNWANAPVTDVTIWRNIGTSVKKGVKPFFAGASIDPNGRPIGPLSDRPPGNQDIPNNWAVSRTNRNQIKWNKGSGNAISNIDLKSIAAQRGINTVQDVINEVNRQNPDFNPKFNPQNDPETIDNGRNVLDGFIFDVDDFNINETISFNWLLDGPNIDKSNEFGSGVVNLVRIQESVEPIPIFPDIPNFGNTTIKNTGFKNTPVQFVNGIDKAYTNPNLNNNEAFGLEIAAVPRDALPAPEPITILGSISALGIGSLLKTKFSKRQNKAS